MRDDALLLRKFEILSGYCTVNCVFVVVVGNRIGWWGYSLRFYMRGFTKLGLDVTVAQTLGIELRSNDIK
jgi:hypothetical protein